MPDKIKDTNERLAKAKVIEGMLVELDMSREELIKLIKAMMERSVSEGKVEDVDISQLAERAAGGDSEYMARYLSLEQLRELNIHISYAFSLKRAKDLGLIPDLDKISQLISLANISKLLPEGKAVANGKMQPLSSVQLGKISGELNSMISGRSYQSQEAMNKNSLMMNDPNDQNNQNSSVNVVKRVTGMIRMQMQAIGVAAGAMISGAPVPAQLQANQIQNLANTAARINSHMRRHERQMKKIAPEVSSLSHRKGQVFATVRTTGGEREVKLSDHLRENKKLTPQAEKILNNFMLAGDKLELTLESISKASPDIRSLQFSATGKLQVTAETEGKLKIVNIADYINDLTRNIDKLKNAVDNKKSELETKRSDIERAKDLTRGPELDNANLANAKISSEELLKYSRAQEVRSDGLNEKTEKKEVKRVGDELIKLDAMSDKARMLESLKGTTEMKAIESSMKDVMKHMEEAQTNKDLLDNLKKDLSKGKFLDKS